MLESKENLWVVHEHVNYKLYVYKGTMQWIALSCLHTTDPRIWQIYTVYEYKSLQYIQVSERYTF